MSTRRKCRFSVPEIPGVFHHADEILVVVNRCANAAVVVDEVVFRYLVIGIISLKHVQILFDDLLLGLFAGDELGMTADVIGAHEVSHCNHAVSRLVHLAKSLVDYVQSRLRHRRPESLKELIEADVSAAVSVNVADHLRHFSLGEPHSVVVQALRQLFTIQRSAAVVVHDAKCPANAVNTSGATLKTCYAQLLNGCGHVICNFRQPNSKRSGLC